jgi:serine/threonine-protein kinase
LDEEPGAKRQIELYLTHFTLASLATLLLVAPILPAFSSQYAVVYSAKWDGRPEKVAVKVLKKEHCGSQGPILDMQAETQILSKLQNNPGIVNIFASGETIDGRPFFIMEKLSGTTLGPCIKNIIDYRKRLDMAISLARIFESLHKGAATEGKKVLHRDLKPANVGVTPQTGQLRLLDFGLVRLLHYDEER